MDSLSIGILLVYNRYLKRRDWLKKAYYEEEWVSDEGGEDPVQVPRLRAGLSQGRRSTDHVPRVEGIKQQRRDSTNS
jgi:hypothetical protein